MTEVEIEAIIKHLSAIQITSWIWTSYRSSLVRAQLYFTYNQLHCISLQSYQDGDLPENNLRNGFIGVGHINCSSDDIGKQSLDLKANHNDSDILDTKYLMQVFDERLGTVNVKKMVKNKDGNEEETSIVENRSSSRLTSVDETQLLGELRHKDDYKRLALVFDPFCYINQYNKMTFNPYLRVSTEYCTSIIPRTKVESELGDVQSTEESLVRCIPYKQSYFTNAMEEHFAIDDKTEGIIEVPLPPYPLVLSSWPIYNHSPIRSICRFLETVYISLGSLQLLGDTSTPVPCSSEIKYYQNVKKNKGTENISWLSALALANTVDSLRILAFQLYKGIHPQVFIADWFLTEGEIARANIDTSISHKKKEIGDKGKNSMESSQKIPKNPFFIGRNNNGSIRVHRLLKLSKGFQMHHDEEEVI
jgi:hypothetical protein